MGSLNRDEIKEKFLGALQEVNNQNFSENQTLDMILNEVIFQIDTLIQQVHTLEERLTGPEDYLAFLDLMDFGILNNHGIEQTVSRIRQKASYLAGIIHGLPMKDKSSVNNTTSN